MTASASSLQPAAWTSASPATCSRQPPQAYLGARTSASPATGTTAADSHLSLPCSPQPPPVRKTASSACPSSQDLCQPSHRDHCSRQHLSLPCSPQPPPASKVLTSHLPVWLYFPRYSCSHRPPHQSSSHAARTHRVKPFLRSFSPQPASQSGSSEGSPSSRSFPPSASQSAVSLEASLLLHSALPSRSPRPATD